MNSRRNDSDLEFLLVNYENNLNEDVGLFVTEDGLLCEQISNMEVPINGLYHTIVEEQGCTGVLIVDYKHQAFY